MQISSWYGDDNPQGRNGVDRLRRAGRRRSPDSDAGRYRGLVRLLLTTLVAHVTIDPPQVAKDRFARLAFRVPNEREDAVITHFRVRLPAEHPIRYVSVRPLPGWAYQVETAPPPKPARGGGDELTDVVSGLTWTGGKIAPGEFEEFVVSLGPLPHDTDQLLFPATQTYDDGAVVHFDKGRERSGHPAPAVTLLGPIPSEPVGKSSGSAATQSDLDAAHRRATASLVVGTIGLAVAAIALLRSRRARSSPRRM
jgi:uncharacterized protein YcnI